MQSSLIRWQHLELVYIHRVIVLCHLEIDVPRKVVTVRFQLASSKDVSRIDRKSAHVFLSFDYYVISCTLDEGSGLSSINRVSAQLPGSNISEEVTVIVIFGSVRISQLIDIIPEGISTAGD